MYTQGHILNLIVVANIPIGHKGFELPYFWSWDRDFNTAQSGLRVHESFAVTWNWFLFFFETALENSRFDF